MRWSSVATIFLWAPCFSSEDILIRRKRLSGRHYTRIRRAPRRLYGIGSVYLNQNKNAAARETFERAVKLPANYPDTLPDAWNNLGVIATREGRVDDSVPCFLEALRLNPHHLLSLDNLGNAYRAQKRWEEARKVLERAVEVAPGGSRGKLQSWNGICAGR